MKAQTIAAGRPRVTHVVRQFWPQRGGLEESVRQLCRALADDFDADFKSHIRPTETVAESTWQPKVVSM